MSKVNAEQVKWLKELGAMGGGGEALATLLAERPTNAGAGPITDAMGGQGTPMAGDAGETLTVLGTAKTPAPQPIEAPVLDTSTMSAAPDDPKTPVAPPPTPPRPRPEVVGDLKVGDEIGDVLRERAERVIADEGVESKPRKRHRHGSNPKRRLGEIEDDLRRIANDPGSPRREEAKKLLGEIEERRKALKPVNREIPGSNQGSKNTKPPPKGGGKPGTDPKTPPANPATPKETPKTPSGTTPGGKVTPKYVPNPATTGAVYARLKPALKALGGLGAKFVGSVGRVGSSVKVPLFAALEVLNAIQFIEMTESAIKGNGFKFTKEIAKAESLGKDVSALVKGYKDSNLHKDLSDMVAKARKIDAEDPDGLYGSDMLSEYCVQARSVVSDHKDNCEKLWDHLTTIDSDVAARFKYANFLLNDKTFWVAIGIATQSSVIHAELFVAVQDMNRILGALYSAKYRLEPHLKIVRGDMGVIEANILDRTPIGITTTDD